VPGGRGRSLPRVLLTHLPSCKQIDLLSEKVICEGIQKEGLCPRKFLENREAEKKVTMAQGKNQTYLEHATFTWKVPFQKKG